jgi:TfoX/Sxy family transcriptional regulator of competence genes
VAYDERLAERVRHLIAARPDFAERKMMGGLCFMVGGKMCCGVSGAALLVRVGRDGYAAALAEPQVRPMDLAGRSPQGFVLVDAAACRSDKALAAWVKRGVAIAEAAKDEKPAARRKRSAAKSAH